MKIYELRQQRQREQEERAKRKREIERANPRPATSPRPMEQTRSFDHLDAAEFERRIDLETGEIIDGDDYVSGASNHNNRPPVGEKAGNYSGQTTSVAPGPRREPSGRMTEETARTEETRPPRPPAPISQPTNDKRQAPPVTSSSAQAQSKPTGGEIPPKKRRRDRGYER